jgi:hypothetical protein
MHDDQVDEVAGLEKTDQSPEDPAPRRWARRDALLVALTVLVSWVLSRRYYSPSTHDVQTLEAYRTLPFLHVDVAEMPGSKAGEMDLTIDMSNIGHLAAEILLGVRPIEARASIDNQATVESTPAFTTKIGPGNATIELKDPLEAGAGLSIAIRGIKTAFPPRWRYGVKGTIAVDVLAGKHAIRISFFRSLRRPSPADDK